MCVILQAETSESIAKTKLGKLHFHTIKYDNAMGKNKWYFESENNSKQPGSIHSSQHQGKPKKSNLMPSLFVLDSPENMPLPKLLRLVWLRLRRSWVALRFQLNRWSFGIFKNKIVIQVGIAAASAFFLLGPDGSSGILTRPESETSAWAQETNLEVGAEEYHPPSKAKKAAKKAAHPVSKRKNEAAPVSARELMSQQTKDYIQRYGKIAREEMQKYGVPASISLAQGLIESRAGTSKLAMNNNNHFGMKCFAKNCKKGHCSNFTDDTHKDFFKKFANPWDSWRAHSQLLSSGRYSKLKKHGRNYRNWAYGLKSVGYATDRTYAEKLIGIIERYNLHQYDK